MVLFLRNLNQKRMSLFAMVSNNNLIHNGTQVKGIVIHFYIVIKINLLHVPFLFCFIVSTKQMQHLLPNRAAPLALGTCTAVSSYFIAIEMTLFELFKKLTINRFNVYNK